MGSYTLEILPVAKRPVFATANMQHLPISDLYERYADLVLRTAVRITGRAEDAEDVLQSVFLRLMKQSASQLAALLGTDRLTPAPDAQRLAEAYLRRAATNASIDALRRRNRRAEIDMDKAPEPVAGNPAPELKERLRRCLSTLDQEDAELFALRYLEGYTNVELAELLGMEVATVGTRLFRIRQALQQELSR